MTQIRKAVIAAAGMGTRFLPMTKAMPKEMLPIIDKPVIQILVEQIVAAGVEDIIIVTGPTKRAIEDHFDRSFELEQQLHAKGKEEKANEIKRIGNLANFIYIRQKGSLGNARPVLNAKHLINGEPFFYFYADEFFQADIPAPKQMLEAHNASGGKSVLATVKLTDRKDTSKYGIIEPGADLGSEIHEVRQIIEKPDPETAPSMLAANGGYLFTSDIFDYINEDEISARGELEIQGAIDRQARNGGVVGKVIDGKYQDGGSVERYLQAVVDHALEHPDYGREFEEYISSKVK